MFLPLMSILIWGGAGSFDNESLQFIMVKMDSSKRYVCFGGNSLQTEISHSSVFSGPSYCRCTIHDCWQMNDKYIKSSLRIKT